jgi:hypothetical protein
MCSGSRHARGPGGQALVRSTTDDVSPVGDADGYVGGVPVDPTPFLSTVITVSATLVAIVGGLLVARFVGLDSDQRTSRKLIGDARDRLVIARGRAVSARQDLIRWRAQGFLDQVAGAIVCGETDIGELRKLARTRLTDDELRTVISQSAQDVAALESWLSPDTVLQRIRAADYQWQKFPHDDMPTLNYRQLAETVFTKFAMELSDSDEREAERRREEERRRAEEERQRQANSPVSKVLGLESAGFRISDALKDGPLFGGLGATFPAPDYTSIAKAVGSIRPPASVLIDANRTDDLIAADSRARQRVEDLTEELRRLRKQHAEVIKPDARLWWAVAILTAYAISGVAVPLWVMSSGPTSLSDVRWTFWPFAGGLAVLIAYIAWYLIGLSRRGQQWADTDEDSTSG